MKPPLKPTVGSRIATNEARNEEWLGARHVVLGLLSAVIVIATALSLHDVQARQVAHHAAQLEAVSNLHVGQLEHWLEDHLSLARFAGAIVSFRGCTGAGATLATSRHASNCCSTSPN